MPGWNASRQPRDASSVELSFDQGPGKPPPPSHPPPNRAGYMDAVHAHQPRREHEESFASEATEEAMPPSTSKTRRRLSSSYMSMRGRDRDSTVVGAQVMDTGTLLGSRVLLSALAIAMLWCSSLAMITNMLRAANALPIPPVQVVVRGAISLFNETQRLQRNYVDCVRTDLLVCNDTLVRRRAQEAERSEDARRSNAQTRDRSRATQSACATAHARAMASVSAWQQQQGAGGGSGTTSHYTAACTSSERERLEGLTGDTTAQRSAAYQLARGYSHNSQSTVGTLAEQVQARAAYDTSYLSNKILREVALEQYIESLGLNYSISLSATFSGLNLTELLACSTLLAGASCPSGAGARAAVEAAQRNLITQYTQAQSTYAVTAQRSAEHIQSAAATLTSVGTTLADIRDSINARYPEVGFDNFFPDLTIPSACPYRSVTCPSGQSPPCGSYACAVSAPVFDATLPNVDIPASDTVDAIAAATSQAVDNYQSQIGNAVDFANTDASGLAANLAAVQIQAGFPPPDYQPPEIDALRVQRDHQRESEQFEQDAAVSLDAIDQANDGSNSSSTSYAPIFSTNVSASRLIGAVSDTSWFNYRYLEDAGFQFEWLLEPINVLSILLQVRNLPISPHTSSLHDLLSHHMRAKQRTLHSHCRTSTCAGASSRRSVS